jgi:hypothetical protein
MRGRRRLERVREARRRLARDGPPWTRWVADGDFETVSVPERDCDALRDLLIAEGVETVVEVGLAYGRSALAAAAAVLAGAPAAAGGGAGRRRGVRRRQPPVPRGVRRPVLPAQARPARRARRPGRPLVALGPRRGALRLPDPPFEPAFEDFQPFL